MTEHAEQRYTLREAKLELNRQECSWHGHRYEIVTRTGHDGPALVACTRCGKSWPIAEAAE